MAFEIRNTEYNWDIISVLLTVWAVLSLSLLYVLSGSSIVNFGTQLYLILFAVATSAIVILRGRDAFKLGPALYPRTIQKLLGVPGGFLGVAVVQTLIISPPRLDFYSSLVPRIFFSSGGIIEEWLFTFFLQAWFLEILGKGIVGTTISVIVKSVIFTMYHLTVYGYSTNFLIAVLASSVALAILYRYMKEIWINQIVHAAINWVATA